MHEDIIKRLEKATGPDWSIDDAIYERLIVGKADVKMKFLPFTASLDAVIALVESQVGREAAIGMLASAALEDDWSACHRDAVALISSMCRVLLADLFRALQAQESGQ